MTEQENIHSYKERHPRVENISVHLNTFYALQQQRDVATGPIASSLLFENPGGKGLHSLRIRRWTDEFTSRLQELPESAGSEDVKREQNLFRGRMHEDFAWLHLVSRLQTDYVSFLPKDYVVLSPDLTNELARTFRSGSIRIQDGQGKEPFQFYGATGPFADVAVLALTEDSQAKIAFLGDASLQSGWKSMDRMKKKYEQEFAILHARYPSLFLEQAKFLYMTPESSEVKASDLAKGDFFPQAYLERFWFFELPYSHSEFNMFMKDVYSPIVEEWEKNRHQGDSSSETVVYPG